MNLILLHNPQAGTGEPTREELLTDIRGSGHQVKYKSVKEAHWRRELQRPADAIVVAGGDGTLRKAFGLVSERPGPPIVVLPVGSANNIAGSLGIGGKWREIVRGIGRLVPTAFRFGRVKGAGAAGCFFESVGFGVLAELLRLEDHDPQRFESLAGGREGFPRAYAALAKLTAEARPVGLRVSNIDIRLDEQVLWMEVMNIPSIGPRLTFGASSSAAAALPSLKMVLIQERHRESLVGYLRARADGHARHFPAVRWHELTGEIHLSCAGAAFHVDDQMRPAKRKLIISRAEATVPVLCMRHTPARVG